LLTGVSGCGKSTFLRLILGIEKPSKGKVEYYDNQNQVIIPDFDQIGYIAQDVTLFPSSIRDNITMFNDPLNNKVSEVLQKVDLDLSVKEIGSIINPDNILLSGGQKQKIILAREIIDPKSFIFLDEPTSAIDTKTTTKILKIISELPSTIIMIAHNLTPEQKLMFDREIHFSKKGSDENDNT
jgi:ABC-type bacteriocin/lantibiotic exporter with double-glycine peptidase domain